MMLVMESMTSLTLENSTKETVRTKYGLKEEYLNRYQPTTEVGIVPMVRRCA